MERATVKNSGISFQSFPSPNTTHRQSLRGFIDEVITKASNLSADENGLIGAILGQDEYNKYQKKPDEGKAYHIWTPAVKPEGQRPDMGGKKAYDRAIVKAEKQTILLRELAAAIFDALDADAKYQVRNCNGEYNTVGLDARTIIERLRQAYGRFTEEDIEELNVRLNMPIGTNTAIETHCRIHAEAHIDLQRADQALSEMEKMDRMARSLKGITEFEDTILYFKRNRKQIKDRNFKDLVEELKATMIRNKPTVADAHYALNVRENEHVKLMQQEIQELKKTVKELTRRGGKERSFYCVMHKHNATHNTEQCRSKHMHSKSNM